jgi:uncharacterized phiE125 gp8 family phage protein
MKTTLTRDTDFRAITVDEAKQWVRIDNDADDTLVDGLIVAATQAAEAFTGRTISPATFELSFCGGRRTYPLGTAPVVEIVSVEFEDCQGDRAALAESEYLIRPADIGPSLVLNSAASRASTLVVTLEAGYSAPEGVPQLIKQAIAVHVGSAYAGREGQDAAQATFQNLLRPLVVGGF